MSRVPDDGGSASPDAAVPASGSGRSQRPQRAAGRAAWGSPRRLQANTLGLRRACAAVWAVARATAAQAWADRVLGLAAEAGFWALLSLTPLLLVLVAAVGYLTPLFGHHLAILIEEKIVRAAGHVLAPSAVHKVLQPVLTDVLRHGRGGIISLGFLLALWTGSTAMNTYVNTITIAYGMRDVRSAVKARLLAFGLYLGALVTGIIALPLLVTVPGWITAAVPGPALPVLRPGAIEAMLAWLASSFLLRVYLVFAIGHSPTYGALSAPVAALLFLYLTALAALLGAELNAQIAGRRPSHEIPDTART